MKKRHSTLMVMVAVVIIMALSAANLWLIINMATNMGAIVDKSVNEAVNQKLKSHEKETIKPIKGDDGHTPVKGIDYFDGKDGNDGKDSVSTNTTTTIIKEKPVRGEKGDRGDRGDDAPIPVIQCNEERNRWEVTYDSGRFWEVLNGKPIKCSLEAMYGDITANIIGSK